MDQRSHLVEMLDEEEPDYDAAESLGDSVIDELVEIVNTAPALLAAKATTLAARIGSESSGRVVLAAAHHSDPSVRVAAAAALSRMPLFSSTVFIDSGSQADPMQEPLELLMSDEDPGVRKYARRSASERADASESLIRSLDGPLDSGEVDRNPIR